MMQPRGVEVCRIGGHGAAVEVIEMRRLHVKDMKFLGLLWRFFPFIYRLSDRSAMLLQVCRERKWKSMSESTGREEEYICHQSWNLWWRTSMVKVNRRMPRLHTWQTVNFIPNAANYCKKDVLVRYLRRMSASYGNLYDFCPVSFNLPMEYSQLVSEHRRRKGLLLLDLDYSPEESKVVWIAKPVGKSQGKGIFVFERCSDLRYDDQYVVQEYIHRPLLINGYKWDLRLYVCITCNNPLTIYAYEEGIARFATSKYDLADLEDTFSHLTNTSLNKQSPTYYKHKDTVGLGSKWTLSQLRSYFKKQEVQDYAMWQKIWSVLVLTIIGEGKTICQQTWDDSGFQFLGFDVLVDHNLKAHLLEVNLHPGLGFDKCAVDIDVKIPLLHDMFDLLGLPDGRKFPDPAIPSVLESTHQLCAKIMEALKDSSEPQNWGLKDSSSETKRSVEKPHGHKNASSKRTRKLRTGAKGENKVSKGLISQGHSPNLDQNNNEPQFLTEDDTLIASPEADDPFMVKQGTSESGATATDRAPSPFHPIFVSVPVLKKSAAKLQLPVSGPGLSFEARQWKNDAPSVCGKWVRIFPFDKTTNTCSSFSRTNDCRDTVNRVGVHLQAVRDVIGQGNPKNGDDALYDTKLEKQLNTKVWHPS